MFPHLQFQNPKDKNYNRRVEEVLRMWRYFNVGEQTHTSRGISTGYCVTLVASRTGDVYSAKSKTVATEAFLDVRKGSTRWQLEAYLGFNKSNGRRLSLEELEARLKSYGYKKIRTRKFDDGIVVQHTLKKLVVPRKKEGELDPLEWLRLRREPQKTIEEKTIESPKQEPPLEEPRRLPSLIELQKKVRGLDR